jgi:phosphatidylserine decarboxylase
MDTLTKLGIYSQKYLPDSLFTRFTKVTCNLLGKTRKLKTKLNFAKKYNIDLKKCELYNESDTLESFVKKFKTLNDLFQRKLKKKYTLPESTQQDDIISPAQSFVRCVSANKTFKIKKINYTLQKLLQLNDDDIIQEATIYIFRLAPEHYHRIHSPTTSRIISIKNQAGTYKSVDPIILNSTPVLQENFRKIIKFKNGIYLVAIGATCVGSINLTVKKGDKVKHGQDIGTFAFGGSCVVLVIPNKIIETFTVITSNEKYIEPGTLISKFM